MLGITPGLYQNRDGVVYAVEQVRPTGFVVGRLATEDERDCKLALWFPGGKWIDGVRESPMDLVKRVGELPV